MTAGWSAAGPSPGASTRSGKHLSDQGDTARASQSSSEAFHSAMTAVALIMGFTPISHKYAARHENARVRRGEDGQGGDLLYLAPPMLRQGHLAPPIALHFPDTELLALSRIDIVTPSGQALRCVDTPGGYRIDADVLGAKLHGQCLRESVFGCFCGARARGKKWRRHGAGP